MKQRKHKSAGRQYIERNGYGKNWPAQRARALKRDDYTCQFCGAVGRKKGGRWVNISVHHRRKIALFFDPRRKSVDYEAANSLPNLVTACHTCHKVADGHAERKGFTRLK